MKYILLALFVCISLSAQAYCGACEDAYDLKETMADADVIFIGKKIANAGFGKGHRVLRFTAEVEQLLYGDYTKSYINIQSGQQGCYRWLEVGVNQKHLFVVKKDGTAYIAAANACGYHALPFISNQVFYKNVPHSLSQIKELIKVATDPNHPFNAVQHIQE